MSGDVVVPEIVGDGGPPARAVEATLSNEQLAATKVTWDDARMVTTYANVVNVMVTREEMTLLFGMNRTWNMAEAKELTVDLSHRIVLTPYAAKRLLALLTARMRDYEARVGPLTL